MALPTIDDCTCQCHDPSANQTYINHIGRCCVGVALAWGALGIDDVAEMVSEHGKSAFIVNQEG